METETDLVEQEELEETDPTAEAADVSTEVSDETEAWDRDRQALDFERANARRAREELDTITEAYEQSKNQIEQFKQEIENLKTAKQEEKDKLEDMDPDMADEKVIKNIRLINTRLDEKSRQLDDALKKIALYEQQQAEDKAKRLNEQAKEDVFTTVEEFLEDMGVKGAARYRNEANKMADDMVDSGKCVQPKTFKQAVKLLRECYLQVKKQKDKGTKKTVSVDTGKSGTGVGEKKSGIKSGPIDDVYKQMLKDRSWLDED